MNAYVPREGSAAGQAVAYLRENGETASGPLAAALEVSIANLQSMLEYAVRNGAIRMEKREGLRYWSIGTGAVLERGVKEAALAGKAKVNEELVERLVQAVEAPSTPGVSTKAAQIIPKIIPAAEPCSTAQASDTPQGGIKAKSSERQAVQGPVAEAGNGTAPAPPPPATRELPPSPAMVEREGGEAPTSTEYAAFRCALWSDGRLVLELDDRPLVLSLEQTRQLCHYLDRLSPEAA